MSKFIVYSKTSGEVWRHLDQYITEDDGTIFGGVDGTNTLKYPPQTNVGILEISDDIFAGLDLDNIDKYLVKDNSISENPDWKPAEDETNNINFELIDAINTKVDELDRICKNIIYRGCEVTLSDGSTSNFTLDDQDQANLSGIALKLIGGATQISWHIDDTTQSCRFYSAADAWTIINTLSLFKEYHITYFRDLRIYVNSLTDVSEIKQIQYGHSIPDEFKSDVLKYYEAQITSNT